MRNQKTPVVKEGFPFIGIALALTLSSAFLLPVYVTLVFLALLVFVTAFFRNPRREIPENPRAIVSPADGRVINIREIEETEFLKDRYTRISVFMSVFNVHVNRSPIAGRVVKVAYFPGKFLVASLDKASAENERNAVVIETKGGKKVMFVQIAGLVARRIVCYLKEGDVIEKGLRIGLIRFGSRLDLYIPRESNVFVSVGDRVRGGQTIAGELP
jgi:phosphatidylserine decarboxylase